MTRFHRVRQSSRRIWTDRTGGTAIEYALIASLVALGVAGSIGAVGTGTAALIQQAADSFDGN